MLPQVPLEHFPHDVSRQLVDEHHRAGPLEAGKTIITVSNQLLFVHAASDRLLDHRVVHDLVIGAVTAAAGPWYQDAGGEPWQVPSVLGYEGWHPLLTYQLAVDISAEIETKMAALACHRSQMEVIPYDQAFRGLARYRGIMSISGDYAEVFEVIQAGAMIGAAIEAKAR